MKQYHQISIEELIKRSEKQGTCALCEYGINHLCYFAGKVTSCVGYKPIDNPCIHCLKESKCAEHDYICDVKFICADNTDVPKNPTDIPCASCSWNPICAEEGNLRGEGCFMHKIN